MGYEVFVQTRGPVRDYYMELMLIGHRHFCFISPDAPYAQDNTTHYLVPSIDTTTARRNGNGLVQELRGLEFVVSATFVDTKKLH